MGGRAVREKGELQLYSSEMYLQQLLALSISYKRGRDRTFASAAVTVCLDGRECCWWRFASRAQFIQRLASFGKQSSGTCVIADSATCETPTLPQLKHNSLVNVRWHINYLPPVQIYCAGKHSGNTVNGSKSVTKILTDCNSYEE